MPFGVELPENLGVTSTEQQDTAPSGDTAPAGDTPSGEQNFSKAESKPETIQDVLDLDKLDRSFRFNGREWTAKDLRNAYMMREDYTRKTQELAEARKYAENFDVDLQKVLRDPRLIGEMKKVYPRHYVEIAERWLGNRGGQQSTPTAGAQQPNESQAEYERRIAELEGRIAEWDKSQQQAEIAQIEAWLNNQYEALGKKYQFANAEVVTARAEVLSKSGTKVTDKVLDKLFKASHDEMKSRWEKHYQTKVQEQLKTGVKGKDVGPGGGVPGQAPKGLKTMKDAKEAMLAAYGGNR